MLKMKSKFDTQKVKKQNRTMNFILGVQHSRSTTSRAAFVTTASSSRTVVRTTLNNNNNNNTNTTDINSQLSSPVNSNEQLLQHSSETRIQQNNNKIMEAIPSHHHPGVTAKPGVGASWITTISAVPQLVTAAQTRAVLIKARKEEPNIVQNRKNSGWTISSSSPAIRSSKLANAPNSQVPSTYDDDDDDDVIGEPSKYFSESSTPVRNPTFRTERTPIRSVLNAIQGPSSPSEISVQFQAGNTKDKSIQKKKAANPYLLQSPWVTRCSDSQLQLENPIPHALASPVQTARLTVKEMLDLMCPPKSTNENAMNLDAEKTILENDEMNSQNIID